MTGTECTVTVVLSFAVSEEKARVVLERWWTFKEHRKRYMRLKRSGAMKKKEPLV